MSRRPKSGFFNNRAQGPDRGGDRGGRGKHPGHLKGRDIGLWYASRSKQKKEENEGTISLEPDISIAPGKITEIRKLLTQSKFLSNLNQPEAGSSSDCPIFRNDFLRVTTENIEEQMLLNIVARDDKTKQELEKIANFDEKLQENYAIGLSSENELFEFRQRLPCWKKRFEIVDLIKKNPVILIKGETGCGKTTQVTQFILDDAIASGEGSKCRIVCTQPRRISAITVAERVAAERGEDLGKSVGYVIRCEGVRARQQGATIQYVTTGVLLRYLQSDPALLDISHIILDEAHERDINTDLCLGILKLLVKHRKDIRIIIMSATLKAEIFSEYFDNCPTLEVEGFTFPVEEKYLEDVVHELNYFKFSQDDGKRKGHKGNPARRREDREKNELADLLMPCVSELRQKYSSKVVEALMSPKSEEFDPDFLEELIFHISTKMPPGAVLVFLPGYAQISTMLQKLQQSRRFPKDRYTVLPLHSLLSGPDQKKVFKRPPHGVRKIILSTNIAETSVTIDDIVYVINGGKRKGSSFDVNNNIAVLEEMWVSKANAKQRKGRAGRCQPGVCFHLFSRARFESLDDDMKPEILCTRLEGVILTLKLLGIQVTAKFLSELISPPSITVVNHSVALLKRLSAITDSEVLTPLGFHLAKLPVDPQSGKMLLFAAIFGCLESITTVAACLGFKDPFYTVMGKEREVDGAKLKLAANCKSDHLMYIRAYEEWFCSQKLRNFDFSRQYFLSNATLTQLKSMKLQFIENLQDAKFVRTTDWTEIKRNQQNTKLVKAVIAAGLYPNIAKVYKVITSRNSADGMPKVATKEDGGKVKIFPSSVLARERMFDSKYLVYHLKRKSNGIFLHDCSTVNPTALLLFGDKIEPNPSDGWIGVADFLKFKCNIDTQRLILDLRVALDVLLQNKVRSPAPIDWESEEGSLLNAIIQFISADNYNPYEDDDFYEGGDGNLSDST